MSVTASNTTSGVVIEWTSISNSLCKMVINFTVTITSNNSDTMMETTNGNSIEFSNLTSDQEYTANVFANLGSCVTDSTTIYFTFVAATSKNYCIYGWIYIYIYISL